VRVLYLWVRVGLGREWSPHTFRSFVWGRPRLPLNAEDFGQRFTVVASSPRQGGGDDALLPRAATCVFQLELPAYVRWSRHRVSRVVLDWGSIDTAGCRYSSEDVMARQLRVAITSCVAIDTDFIPSSREAWRDLDDTRQVSPFSVAHL